MASAGKTEHLPLRDREQYPTDAVLKKALGKSFAAFDALMAKMKGPDFGLSPEWRYYDDGKAWLCKVARKSKTVFWISVRERRFTASFYFTEAKSAGIHGLKIDAGIIRTFREGEPVGALRPLVMVIAGRNRLPDLFTVIGYKIGTL